MAATAKAFGNVIRFPDAARDQIAGADRSADWRSAVDFLAQKLREAMRSLVPEIDEEMLTRGDLADEREQRNLYYGAHETLSQNRLRLDGLLAANWLRLLDEAGGRSPKQVPARRVWDPDDLQLVEFGAVDEDLAVKAIANQLKDGCEDELFAIGRRLAFLAGRDGEFPVAELLARAFHATVRDVGFSAPVRLEVLRAIARHAVRDLSPALRAANAYLVGRKVLPALRRSYACPGVGNATDKNAGAPEGPDAFALLHRLVTAGTREPAGGLTGVPPYGQGHGISMASMAAAMEKVMISLDALQRSMPPAQGHLPTTQVLREFRASEAGRSLGHLDAVTADIVATLFDFIFDDPAIADPIKALISRIQIPVLKVAMLDRSFFSSRAHPARRLLDGISRAAVRCGPGVGREDPLYTRVAAIIEHLQSEFNQDAGLFDVLCMELTDFLDSQEVAADERATRAAPLVAAQEAQELAALAADQALADWLAMPLPAAVADLLTNEWRMLLVRHYLNGDSGGWAAAADMIAELVASVQPQPGASERKRLAASLPSLVRFIHESLDRSQVPDGRRLVLVDALFHLHAAVLRGSIPELAPSPLPQSAKPEIISESVHEDGTHLERISLVQAELPPTNEGARDLAAQVADLSRGDWVEFVGAEGFERYRLSWVSPQRGILLFTNPQSPRALSITPAALVVQLQRGDASVVSAEPIFDRAMNRALESLQAA